MISDWTTITTATCATRPAISALRRTGETSSRSVTPRSMSSIVPIPLQPDENSADMTTIPGARYAMYEPPKPGRSATFLKSSPNSSSQISGCTSVTATYQGWRQSARRSRAAM